MADRLAMFDAVIAKGSEDPFVFYARAMEFRSRGEKDKALKAFDELAERFGDYVPTYLMAAQVCGELENEEGARGWCDRGLIKAKLASDGHAASELQAFLDEL